MTDLGRLPPSIVSALPAEAGRAFVDRLALVECPSFTARRRRRQEATDASHDPIVWCEARGANVLDADGNVFVDLSGGFGAAAVGHGHPAVREAVTRQSGRLSHALGDLHPSDVKITLLERLAALSPWEDTRVVLSLSGSDAVTTALKTAAIATGRAGVVAFEGGYHGLGYGPLAACGYNDSFRQPFAAQLNPAVTFVPYGAVPNDLSGVGAVLVEPIQARGGVHVPPSDWLVALGQRCREQGALMIADEIFTGLGRCGSMWLSADANPDLICTGKALGGGFPVSACLGRADVMQAWGDCSGEAIHTGTFFGHPVGSAAALAALDVVEAEGLAARADRLGRQLIDQLRDDLNGRCVEVRGRGLLIGIDLGEPGRALTVCRALLERGYIALPAGEKANVVQLAPPLTIDSELLDGFVRTISEIL